MDLHSAIMNIQEASAVVVPVGQDFDVYSYKLGHRDARHKAAELSLSHEQAMTKQEMKELIENFLRFADHQYNSDLNEWNGPYEAGRMLEKQEVDKMIEHFLEGDE